MPANKNALIRYRIIDGCLRNKYHRFPNKYDFIKACENLGNVSKRTIEQDLYNMQFDEELGYFAPIVYNKLEKGYSYADPEYSINQFPLKPEDLDTLAFATSILKQFGALDPVQQLLQTVGKMEAFLSRNNGDQEHITNSYIEAEKGFADGGTEFMNPFMNAIRQQKKCLIAYKRFNTDDEKSYLIHPYVLKQYRFRWYVIGYSEKRKDLSTFALDRLQQLEVLTETFKVKSGFDPKSFFKYSIGITANTKEKAERVRLSFQPNEAPFLKSQPIHASQQIIEDSQNAFVIELEVLAGYELLSIILGYGETVEVLKPEALRLKIKTRLEKALAQYK